MTPDGAVVIFDTGLPAKILQLVLQRNVRKGYLRDKLRRYVELLKGLRGGEQRVFIGISILDPYNEIYSLEEVQRELELEGVVLPILQLNGGIGTVNPLFHQVDIDGDRAGSICPSRGGDELRNIAAEFTEKFGAFSIDITDMFVFSPEGLTSCMCDSCKRTLRDILREDIRDESKAYEVINAVLGKKLAHIVNKVSKTGYSIINLSKFENSETISEELDEETNEEMNAVKVGYLFFKARSKLTARFVLSGLKDVKGYKAVFLEGSSMEGATSVFTKTFINSINDYDIDFYTSIRQERHQANIGVYNLNRGRYLVNQFSEALWTYVNQTIYLSEILISIAIKKAKKERSRKPRDLELELLRRFQKLTKAAATAWEPPIERLSKLKGKYAVYGRRELELAQALLLNIDEITEYYDTNPSEVSYIF